MQTGFLLASGGSPVQKVGGHSTPANSGRGWGCWEGEIHVDWTMAQRTVVLTASRQLLRRQTGLCRLLHGIAVCRRPSPCALG